MIQEIQYLRGIAALMVVALHTVPQIRRMGYAGPDPVALSHGVDLFFVISGFIMTHVTWDRPTTPWVFLKHRIVRIVPLYWALTTLVLAVGLLAPALLQSTRVEAGHYLKSLFFIPFVHPVSGGHFPLVQPGWTLNLEMYFYLVFALCLVTGRRTRLALVVATLTLAAMAIRAVAAPDSILMFYAGAGPFEFSLGVVLGVLHARCMPRLPARHGTIAGAAALCSGVAALIAADLPLAGNHPLTVAAMASALIVAGALLLRHGRSRFGSPMLAAIGDASYALYLSHVIFMSALGQLARSRVLPVVGPDLLWIFPVVSVCACTVLGLLVHRHIERPLTRRIRAALA